MKENGDVTNVTVLFTKNELEKMDYIVKVFRTRKTRVIKTMIYTDHTLNKLYDFAKEYANTYDEDDGVDLSWMLERKIMLT